tara:strand:+ start:257 stop:472 length:216 start_codon:yes stop_codon:yes gene_type:complete
MNKWKAKSKEEVVAQFDRLDKMTASKMTPDLKKCASPGPSQLSGLAFRPPLSLPAAVPLPLAPSKRNVFPR